MNTMSVKVDANILCDLCSPHFTYDACVALINHFEEMGCDESPVHIGDLCISFSEIPSSYADDYDEDVIIAYLDNGNVLVAN